MNFTIVSEREAASSCAESITDTSDSSWLESLSYGRQSSDLLLLSLCTLLLSCIFTVLRRTSPRLDFGLVIKSLRCRRLLDSKTPHVHHPIPYIGHLLQLQHQSAAYITALIHNLPYNHFTINILSYKIHILSPSWDKALSRHLDDMSLAQTISIIGPTIFDLSPKTVGLISENNPRLRHKEQLLNSDGARAMNTACRQYAKEIASNSPRKMEVDLEGLMFANTTQALAAAVWGPENPWCKDGEFVEKFMQLADCFDNLGRPLNWFTAPKAYGLRKFLFRRLQAYHDAHPGETRASAHQRINSVSMYDANWDSNPDYLSVEMIIALGFTATASTLTSWTLSHLLTRQDVLHKVATEARCLPETEQGHVDLGSISATAPWLVASWYESLRLHMTGIPRLACRDFEMSHSSSPCSKEPATRFRKGDIILLPMYTHNRDASVFGADTDEFRPERLLDGRGQLDRLLVRKIKCFGVGGNLCPGRQLGQDAALATLAETLKRYKIERKDGREFEVPQAANGLDLGFQRYKGKTRAVLTRRPEFCNLPGS